MKKVGYIQGTFDMFHIGHLNLFKNAKNICDELIVAVNTDELVFQYKHKKTIIPLEERVEILRAVKYIDKVVVTTDRDKEKAHDIYKFNYLIMGDDWKNTPFYIEVEKKMKKRGVEVVYFPYTKGISSSKLRKIIGDDGEKD